jgi:hypothetical protein
MNLVGAPPFGAIGRENHRGQATAPTNDELIRGSLGLPADNHFFHCIFVVY